MGMNDKINFANGDSIKKLFAFTKIGTKGIGKDRSKVSETPSQMFEFKSRGKAIKFVYSLNENGFYKMIKPKAEAKHKNKMKRLELEERKDLLKTLKRERIQEPFSPDLLELKRELNSTVPKDEAFSDELLELESDIELEQLADELDNTN